MIKVEHKFPTAMKVEVGDVFFINEETYLQLIEITGGMYGLFDIQCSELVSGEINCEVHAINHVKKHYGEYELIKGSRITFKIAQ